MNDFPVVSSAAASGTPRARVIEHLLADHRRLVSVLILVERLVGDIALATSQVDSQLLAQALCYIDTYAERRHHPAEERFLCAPLRARCAEAADLVERVEDDHRVSAQLLIGLSRCHLRYQAGLPGATYDLVSACSAYVQFQIDHIVLEAGSVLPTAARWLTAEDWAQAAAVLAVDDDPLCATPSALDGYRQLREQVGGLLELSNDELLARATASLNALQYLEA